jgi:hypothetical protein
MARLTRKQIREGLEQTPIDALILPNPTETRLTAKQREFARLVALGETKAESYRSAYNTKGKKNTQRTEAYKLTQNPDVSNMINTFAQAKQFAESHTAEQLRAFVVQQLVKHASDEDVPPAVRVQALRLIGQHSGVDSFAARQVEVTHHKSGDIRERILDKLKLIGASTTIEANSVQDDDQDADSLLAELTPSPSETPETDTHPTHAPQFAPVDGDEHTHSIPHNRTEVVSDFDAADADWVDSPSIGSLSIADDKPLPSGNWAAESDLSTVSLETLQVTNQDDSDINDLENECKR